LLHWKDLQTELGTGTQPKNMIRNKNFKPEPQRFQAKHLAI